MVIRLITKKYVLTLILLFPWPEASSWFSLKCYYRSCSALMSAKTRNWVSLQCNGHERGDIIFFLLKSSTQDIAIGDKMLNWFVLLSSIWYLFQDNWNWTKLKLMWQISAAYFAAWNRSSLANPRSAKETFGAKCFRNKQNEWKAPACW